MHFIKQPTSLPVRNFDLCSNREKNIKRHGELLPSSIRCIIYGPSNCGKTNVLMSLIEDPNGLRFENVYIYSKSLDQEKYKYLEKILTSIDGVGFYKYSTSDDVIEPKKAKHFR